MAEIDIKELIGLMLRKWWILVLSALIVGCAAAVYTEYYITPLYSAHATLYVGKNSDEQGLNSADLYIGATLIQDYSEIATSRLVASAVADELGLKMDPNVLSGKISVYQKQETRVIEITVTDPNPELAMLITNKEAEVFKQKVAEIMQIDNVQIIDKAELPLFPISPDLRRNELIGAIIGFAIGLGVIFLIEFLDNTIKTPDDVKKYTDLPVIGAIPEFRVKRKGA